MDAESYGRRRSVIYEAAQAIAESRPLSDEQRRVVSETLKQWLDIEFYKKRNLLSEYENAIRQSNQAMQKIANDMHFLDQASKGGPSIFKAAVAAIAAKESGKHAAATLVEFFKQAFGLNNTKASERAAELLERDPESVRQQYLTYKRTK